MTAALPACLIVFTGEDFYLRVDRGSRIDLIELKDNVTLPGARKSAADLGFEPDGWVDRTGHVQKFYTKSPR